jgi:IPT/TIG domain-containing protein/BACON domain-containing protein
MFSWIAHRLCIARTYSYFLGAALLVAALHGCSGGGGGDGGGGGSNAPSYSLSSSSVAFSANQGGAAPPQQVVTVSVTSGTLFVKTSQTGNNFGHTFSLTGPMTGQITITPGVTFNAGSFAGTITVHACTDASCLNDIAGSPKTIDVTYTVTGLGVAPTALNFESTTGQMPSPQDVTLSLIPGGSASWTSSVNYTSGASGWLTLGPASGSVDTPQTVSLGVNAAPVSAEVRTATVTFTAGALTQNVAVTYTISSPRVDFVSPYVAASGVDGTVILRGHGFFSLNSGTTTVDFGTAATSSVLILSDTEIQAVYPGLTAGSYNITVSDAGAPFTTRSGVKLLVVDPLPPSAAATIARSAGGAAATDLIYDAERKALYLMDQQANRLERHQFNGTTWALTSMPFAGGGTTNRRITLSPDGTLLLKTSGDGSLLTRIATATFAALPGDDAAPIGSTALNRIAFANDGTAIGNSAGATTLYRYDMLTRQFVILGTDFDLLNRHIAASSDGDTLVLTSELLSSGGAILTYDASNGTLTERTAGNATDLDNDKVSISRDGSRILLLSPDSSGSGNRPVVYDASFAVLGRLPVGLNGFVLKPDGSAAYGYYPGSTSVRKFDLTQPPDGNGVFPEDGSGTVITAPGTSSTAMTMSPEGTTLFLAGDQNLIVLSVP